MVRTCHACPAQWDGFTSTKPELGDYYYFRYRFGSLTVTKRSQFNWECAIVVFEWQNEKDGYDGVMSYDTLKEKVSKILELPDYEEDQSL